MLLNLSTWFTDYESSHICICIYNIENLLVYNMFLTNTYILCTSKIHQPKNIIKLDFLICIRFTNSQGFFLRFHSQTILLCSQMKIIIRNIPEYSRFFPWFRYIMHTPTKFKSSTKNNKENETESISHFNDQHNLIVQLSGICLLFLHFSLSSQLFFYNTVLHTYNTTV